LPFFQTPSKADVENENPYIIPFLFVMNITRGKNMFPMESDHVRIVSELIDIFITFAIVQSHHHDEIQIFYLLFVARSIFLSNSEMK
jgi:hypothetical protein